MLAYFSLMPLLIVTFHNPLNKRESGLNREHLTLFSIHQLQTEVKGLTRGQCSSQCSGHWPGQSLKIRPWGKRASASLLKRWVDPHSSTEPAIPHKCHIPFPFVLFFSFSLFLHGRCESKGPVKKGNAKLSAITAIHPEWNFRQPLS